MIVELVGMPGVGKTSVARQLEEAGIGRRIVLAGKLEIIWWYVRFAFTHPIYTLKGIALVVMYRPKTTVLWNYHVIRYAKLSKSMYVKNGKHCCWLLDEPPRQNVFSLLSNYKGTRQTTHIWNWSVCAGRIIHVRMDEVTRLQRVRARGRNMPNEYCDKWNVSMQEVDVQVGRIVAGLDTAVTIDMSRESALDRIKQYVSD